MISIYSYITEKLKLDKNIKVNEKIYPNLLDLKIGDILVDIIKNKPFFYRVEAIHYKEEKATLAYLYNHTRKTPDGVEYWPNNTKNFWWTEQFNTNKNNELINNVHKTNHRLFLLPDDKSIIIDESIDEKLKIDKDTYIKDNDALIDLILAPGKIKDKEVRNAVDKWVEDNNVELIKIYCATEYATEVKKLSTDISNKIEILSFGKYLKTFYDYFPKGQDENNNISKLKIRTKYVDITPTDKALFIEVYNKNQEIKMAYFVVRRATIYDN